MITNDDDKWAFSTRFDPKISDDDINTGFSKKEPTTDKDFKKVYNDLNDDEKNQGTKTAFDPKKTKPTEKPKIPQTLLDEAGRLAVTSMKGTMNKGGNVKAANNMEVEAKVNYGEDDLEEEEMATTTTISPMEMTRVQPDLATVNPLVGVPATANVTENVHIQKSSLHEIATQVIEKLQYMESAGKTETMVTLKHPPIFEGSTLTLTSYQSARGEFNIMFSDLTAQAKYLMDMQVNQDSLRQALIDKGYTVHIFIATTEKETLVTRESAEAFDKQRRDQEQQQQQQQENPEENA